MLSLLTLSDGTSHVQSSECSRPALQLQVLREGVWVISESFTMATRRSETGL